MPPSIDITHSAVEHYDSYAPSPLPESHFSSQLSSDSDEEPPQGRDPEALDALPYFYPSGSREKLQPRDQSNPVATSPPSSSWSRHFVGWRIIVLGSWLNVLILMLPISWATKLLMEDAFALVFSLCILALIPLVRLHDLSTAELAIRIGGSKTGLLNASMSNFIEIVVAISALRKCELRVVHASLVGSILSKLLLILGLCFFAGGMRFSEQGFDPTATQIHSSLLTTSVGVLLLPAAFHFTLSSSPGETAEVQKRDILKMSHGVSIVLIFIYLSYLAFQFWSHTHLYNDSHNKTSARLPATQHISAEKAAAFLAARSRNTFHGTFHGHRKFNGIGVRNGSSSSISTTANLIPPRLSYASTSPRSASPLMDMRHSRSSQSFDNTVSIPTEQATVRLIARKGDDQLPPMSREATYESASSAASSATFAGTDDGDGATAPTSQNESTKSQGTAGPCHKLKEPQLSWFLTILLLVSVTVTVTVAADWLVESMDGISTAISKEWVALILLPAISSVAECITAVRVSVKDEVSLSVSVAVGSTIQTALFVIPFMVILGWITNKPLSLLLDPFQSLVLYLSVQTTSFVIADGKSNWLEGVILVSLYIIIGVSFWFYPGSSPLDFLSVCPITVKS